MVDKANIVQLTVRCQMYPVKFINTLFDYVLGQGEKSLLISTDL